MPRARLAVVLAVALLLPSGRADARRAVRVTDRGGRVVVQTPAAAVEVRKSRLRLLVRDRRRGRIVVSDAAAGGLGIRHDGAVTRLGAVRTVEATADGATLGVATDDGGTATVGLRWTSARALEITVIPTTTTDLEGFAAAWRLARGEAVYGLTERLRDSPPVAPGLVDFPVDELSPPEVGSLDRRGEVVTLRVLPTMAVYAPFYQSSRGYGLWVEGTTQSRFDVGAADPDVLGIAVDAGTLPEHRRLRLHVLVGPEHATILDEYTRLTGRPVAVPAWALGHWRWRDQLGLETGTLDGVTVNGDVADDVNQYDALGIPSGVYLFDRPWAPSTTDAFHFSRFAWDAGRLPNTPAMLQSLRDRGWKTMVWSAAWACGTADGDLGAQALALGFLAPGRGTTGVPECGDLTGGRFLLDVTNPAARSWFGAQLAAFAAAEGIDAIKLDRGEEKVPDLPVDAWHAGAGPEVRNAIPGLQLQLHHEAMTAARGADVLVASRAAWAGSQRWGVVWGGDSQGTELGLRAAIIAQLRAAFMGFPVWGSDTGGYYEFTDREIFARWLQFSAFSGLMEIGGHGTHAPWDMPSTPAYDDELIAIYRRYVRVRAALRDYLVAAAAEASATGMPMARPLPMAFRTDAAVRDRWDEWMLGPDLLVAPVWRSGAREREVYLPRGTWRSWWDPTDRVRGPRTITVAAPLGLIPVYVRDGADVPAPPDA